MNIMEKLNGFKAKTVAAVTTTVVAFVVPTSAHAALATEVKTAIQNGFTDGQEAMGLMIVGFAALFAIGLVLKLLKR